MVRTEEIAGSEVFAMLVPERQQQPARVAADVILMPGGYAANEGDDRALDAVLVGKIEAVKTVDGVDGRALADEADARSDVLRLEQHSDLGALQFRKGAEERKRR